MNRVKEWWHNLSPMDKEGVKALGTLAAFVATCLAIIIAGA